MIITLKLPENILSRTDLKESAKLLLGVMLAGDGTMTVARASSLLDFTQTGARFALENMVTCGLARREYDHINTYARPGQRIVRYHASESLMRQVQCVVERQAV